MALAFGLAARVLWRSGRQATPATAHIVAADRRTGGTSNPGDHAEAEESDPGHRRKRWFWRCQQPAHRVADALEGQPDARSAANSAAPESQSSGAPREQLEE